MLLIKTLSPNTFTLCGHTIVLCGHVITLCGHVIMLCRHVITLCGHAVYKDMLLKLTPLNLILKMSEKIIQIRGIFN